MKNLELDKLNQLLHIIEKKPAQRIVHFSDNALNVSKSIADLCKNYDNDYYLNATTPSFFEVCEKSFEANSHVHVSNFNLKRPRYMVQGIEYDYLIASLDFEKEDKTAFLQKCYPIIKTGGNIIIIVPNLSYKDRDEWRNILEEHYYVSSSISDDLFENFDAIVSKRMHGWGNK